MKSSPKGVRSDFPTLRAFLLTFYLFAGASGFVTPSSSKILVGHTALFYREAFDQDGGGVLPDDWRTYRAKLVKQELLQQEVRLRT